MDSHLDCVREWWDNRIEIIDGKDHEQLDETYKAKCVNIKDIQEADYSMDFFCGFPIVQEVIFSPEETIINFIKTRNELDNDIDSKLKDIMNLLGGSI